MKLDLSCPALALCVTLWTTLSACGGGSPGSPPAGGEATQLPTVQTAEGPVVCTLDHAADVWSCKGIPYAAPPVGSLRWRAPAPAPIHAHPLDGSKYGPGCIQSGSGGLFFSSTMPTSEDCLSLNVWFSARATQHPLPVMVWMHGGGFILGSGSQALYDGTNLAGREALIVTINYRLGPLGWAAHKGLVGQDPAHPGAGNYGLLDQIAALHWVHDNIASFGGDPRNVTIFGESAGAVSVCSLLASPLATGLFQQAIMESGLCMTSAEMSDLTTATAQGDRLATALGCDTATDVVACMRSKPGSTVDTALATGILPGVAGQEGWGPIIDGDAEPTSVADAIHAGKSSNVKFLMGVNADEGPLLVVGSGLNDLNGVTTYMTQKLGSQAASTIFAQYPPSRYGGNSNAAAWAIMGDGLFVCPSQRAAEDFAAKGGKVYPYFFTYVTSEGQLLGWGAFHSSDLPFVFHNASVTQGVSLTTFSGGDGLVADFFEGYWTNMARDGSPGTVKGVSWPSYAGPGGMVMELKPQSAPLQGWPHAADCAVWKQTLGSLL
jgi:para-nitrobenzyl esterase